MYLRCPSSLAERIARGICRRSILVALAAALALLSVTRSYAAAYRSPINVTFSPDGSLLAAADPTWGGVVIIDPQSRSVLREVALKGDPSYVIWNGNDKVLVSEGSAGTVAEVNATSGELIRRLSAVRRATGLAGTSDGKLMLVCDRGLSRVAFVDLDKFEVTKTVDVVREPGYIALTGDDQYAVVSNKLPPSEDARTKEHGAQVSIIDAFARFFLQLVKCFNTGFRFSCPGLWHSPHPFEFLAVKVTGTLQFYLFIRKSFLFFLKPLTTS